MRYQRDAAAEERVARLRDRGLPPPVLISAGAPARRPVGWNGATELRQSCDVAVGLQDDMMQDACELVLESRRLHAATRTGVGLAGGVAEADHPRTCGAGRPLAAASVHWVRRGRGGSGRPRPGSGWAVGAHPIFARCYHLLSPVAERAGTSEHRQELLEGLSGDVVELGAGNGLNFAHYPLEVERVLAIEPDPFLRAKAELAAPRAPVPVSVREGWAEQLPIPDGHFDAAVASLVLCSVPSAEQALGELFRVLRPGGELRFYEHVRAEDPTAARRQDRADVIWPLLGGGCHPNRETVAAIAAAGFDIERVRRFIFQPSRMTAPVAPHVIGRARRP